MHHARGARPTSRVRSLAVVLAAATTAVTVAAGLAAPASITAQAAPAPAAPAAPVGAAGLSAVESAAVEQSAFEPAPVRWGRCRQAQLRDLGLRCSSLVVPLDHADPDGPTIRLALSRLRHSSTSADYQGVMLTNPGGPGSSGLSLPVIATELPTRVTRRWDWIGIDTRGVGASRPRLTCGSPEDQTSGSTRPARSYVPENPADRRFWLRANRAYAQSCDDNASSVLLPHMRTEDLADDLDLVRRALGQEQVGFYGFSYGSLLGQVYASRYPDRLSRLVLDSNLDPGMTDNERNADRVGALATALDRFYRWASQNRRSYGLGNSPQRVRGTVNRLERRLDRQPVRGLGPTGLGAALQLIHYDIGYWRAVASGLSQLRYRNRTGVLKSLLRGPSDGGNSTAAFYATVCTDSPRPSTFRALRAEYEIFRYFKPLSWSQVWAFTPCLNWPAPAAAQRPAVDGSLVDIPVLLAANTGEGVTPLRWSLAVRRAFPTSALSGGKGAYTHIATTRGVPCLDDTAAGYLLEGSLPARGAFNQADESCPVPTPAQQLRRPLGRASGADLLPPAPVLGSLR